MSQDHGVPEGIGDPLTRRSLLVRGAIGTAGVVGAGSLLAACGSGGGGSTGGGGGGKPVTLTFSSWGGAYQEAISRAWLDPYMKANPNVKIVQDNPTDYAKIEAMVRSGNITWDLVDVGNDYGLDSSAPVLTPLDCAAIECSNQSPASGTYRVPFMVFAGVIAYRTDKIRTPPQNWAEYFDLDKFPGKRSFWKYAGQSGTFEAALMADGVAPADLYPLDIDRALKKLDTIKDQIIWWEDIADSTKLLADGEVTIGFTYSSRAYSAVQDGVPIDVVWNQGVTACDYFVVPKGAPNTRAAMDLAAYCCSAEHNADLSKIYPLSPTNTESLANIDRSAPTYRFLPTNHNDVLVPFDDAYYDKNYKQVNERFTEWLQS